MTHPPGSVPKSFVKDPPPVRPAFWPSGVVKGDCRPPSVQTEALGFSTVLSNRQGQEIPVYVRLVLTDFEGQQQVVVTLNDQREESRLRQVLESSRNHLHTLVRHLGEGVMEIDPRGNVLSLHKTGERLPGFLSEDLSGSSAHPLFVKELSVSGKPGEESDFLCSRIRGALVSSNPYDTESCFLKKRDGSLLECSLLCIPVYTSSGGSLQELVVICRDIGSRKKLQKNLQKNEEKYRRMIRNSPEGSWLTRSPC
ncbi:PAS domain-containing protein [Leptospirillum ferriphilum]|uniref:PAS-domain protein n=1 Tax=Leptospirillum ferriphilum (strain ML-04) TaxID=1048260 RepID=J9ZA32_LEPFM|nr:PAS domain-containing protein [Leptospirillum ferriphilum]AFS53360.1 PAS-domain protein [Leptospirillum ferriphilum ML-04]